MKLQTKQKVSLRPASCCLIRKWRVFVSLHIVFFAFLFITQSRAQEKRLPLLLHPPVDFPILLSGNFGELRPNHFHSGIDIETQNVVGKPLRSIADGYISRINCSPFGYGKAIYIDHPSGYTSVYGHLDRFTPDVEAYMDSVRYAQKVDDIAHYPAPGRFPVKMGQLVAYSGNSGRSYGPLLHFEIRDTKSEHPLNTQLFGLSIRDNVKPKFFKLYIYPQDNYSFVNGKNQNMSFPVVLSNGKYIVPGNAPELIGRFGFGIQAQDYMNSSSYRMSLYTISLRVDSSEIFALRMDEFSFDETRYMNSHMDYEARELENIWVRRCYVQPGDKLKIYPTLIDRGIVEFTDGREHTVNIEISDISRNSAVLGFNIKSPLPSYQTGNIKNMSCSKIMPWEQANEFSAADCYVKFDANAFYDTVYFNHAASAIPTGTISALHHIHTATVAVHTPYTLAIKPSTVPDSLHERTVMVKLKNGKPDGAFVCTWENGYYVSREVRDFGAYCLMRDLIPPSVVPLNITNKKSIATQATVVFQIKDALSGIKSYEGTINGKWALFQLDAKSGKLTWYKDKTRFPDKELKLMLKVTDRGGNEKTVRYTLFQ